MSYQQFGRRLWRKVRKRLFRTRQPLCFALSRRNAWAVLYDLSSYTATSFNAAKLLRGERYLPDEIYGLVRLSNNLEEPSKSKFRALLRGVCEHRNMTWPKSPLRLGLPFLAHEEFPKTLSRWLRNLVFEHKSLLIPFHLPSHKVRELPHQCIRDFLHNVKDWEPVATWAPEDIPCPCGRRMFSQLPPDAWQGDHIACGIECLCNVVPAAAQLSDGSAASSFFPGQQFYFAKAIQCFKRWSLKHGFPPCVQDDFETFLWQQWPHHLKACAEEQRLTWHDIHKVKQSLGSQFILRNEDHHNNHVVVYCPRFYWTSVYNTWQDPEVFQECAGSPEYWQHQVWASVPSVLKRKYKWGVSPNASLPTGFVFLKRKKHFRKGRTIISYFHAGLRRLLMATAQCISAMIFQAWGAEPSTPAIWQAVHRHFRDTHASVHFTEVNDDLIGFFNAVPRANILEALRALTADFQALGSTSHFTINLNPKPGQTRAMTGKPRGGNTRSLKSLDLADLELIVRTSFETGVFKAAGRIWRQVRGTSIGNQLSPVLSSLPVLLRERQWRQSWEAQAKNSELGRQAFQDTLLTRYVDNRLALTTLEATQIRELSEYVSLDFTRDTQTALFKLKR